MLSVRNISFNGIHAGAAEIFRPAVELTVLGRCENVQLDEGPNLIVKLIGSLAQAPDIFLAQRQRRLR